MTAVALRLPLPDGPPLDPYALAGRTGVFLAAEGRLQVGLGVAATLRLPHGLTAPDELDRALDDLAAIRCDDRLAGTARAAVGHAVRAFGALPFDRAAAAELTVPALLYAREPDGTEWVTVVADDPSGLPDPERDPGTGQQLRARLLAAADPDRMDPPGGDPDTAATARIVPRSSDDGFRAAVADAVAAIDRGELAKVVLARQADVTLSRPIDVAGLLRRWGALEPSCALFSLPSPAGQFVGASPELLVERIGDRFRCLPLAGTSARRAGRGQGHDGELLESDKDSEEHRLVVDAVRDTLSPLSVELEMPDRPDLVHLHNMTHLGTPVTGILASGDGPRPVVAPGRRAHSIWWPHCTRRRRSAGFPATQPLPPSTGSSPTGAGPTPDRWASSTRPATAVGSSGSGR